MSNVDPQLERLLWVIYDSPNHQITAIEDELPEYVGLERAISKKLVCRDYGGGWDTFERIGLTRAGLLAIGKRPSASYFGMITTILKRFSFK